MARALLRALLLIAVLVMSFLRGVLSTSMSLRF